MIRKIITAIRRAKGAAYVRTLQKQLARLEAKLDRTKGPERFELLARVDAKHGAIRRARAALRALCVALLASSSSACAHAPRPVEAIEAAVIVVEGAIEVCKAKGGDTPEARASCAQVEDIARTRDATTALDDAVEALAEWIADGPNTSED